ncbi:MAG: peptide/nickel transport system permease protein, partial [Chloroflexota bacterium]|nr:peptide/nickel transport system permease protein [Chloroflexota bacterium]
APGDVAQIMAGENQSPAYIEAVRARFGLDQPILIQFWLYLSSVLHGDLGNSFTYAQPVVAVLWQRAPATFLLVGTSLLVASVAGTIVGTVLSRRVGSTLDTLTSLVAVGSYSLPVFWLGIVLVLVFGVSLRWFPTAGMVSPQAPAEGIGRALDVASHLVLPVITLSAVYFGQYVRLARSSVRDVLREDYITAARAAGFPERTILMRYALRNALLPIVTLLGLQMGLVLAGAVLTETVFSWPGLGTLVYQAILGRDVPLVIGAYVAVSLGVLIAALVTDVVYALLDPRVEYR